MSSTTELEFLGFSPELAPFFKSINEEWITEMFEVEEVDSSSLDNPETKIIAPGGEIFFAKHERLGVVGCCALMPHADGDFELTKMGVLKATRGLKVGEQLLKHVLEQAARMPIKRLFLLTNVTCEAAIHLYQKNGFVHDAETLRTYGAAYERCDVAMRYGAIWQDRE